VGDALDAAIDKVIETLSGEQRAKPRFFPDNYPVWNDFFRRRYKRELAAYDGPPPPPVRNNAAGHRRWWSAPGRTLENVLAHIEGGNYPGMPPPQVPSVSRGATREHVDATTDGIPLVRVGIVRVGVEVGIPLVRVSIDAEEDGEEGAGIDTDDQRAQRRHPCHPRGRKRKPRKEDAAAAAASDLAVTEAARAEDAAL
jgi:hypothetical protein